MIRINLAQRKQASYVSGGQKTSGGIGASALKTLAQGGSSAIVPLLTRIGIPIALCVATSFGYDYVIDQKTAEMQTEKESLDKEKDKINKELQKIKGFESVKVELERNGLILRTKIDTIEKLIRGRDFTPKSLISLAQSMPSEVWLTEIDATETNFDFRGGAADISVISDLMSRLGKTIYFKDVALKNTSTDASGKQSNFELTARRE